MLTRAMRRPYNVFPTSPTSPMAPMDLSTSPPGQQPVQCANPRARWLWAVDWRRRGSSDLLQSHFHIRVSCQGASDTPPGGPGHRVGGPTCPCFDMHAICMAAIALACAHSQLTPRSGDTRKHGYSSTVLFFHRSTPGILEYPSTIHRRVIFLKKGPGSGLDGASLKHFVSNFLIIFYFLLQPSHPTSS